MNISSKELLERLREAEDNMWSIINSYGYKGYEKELENANKNASDYFNKYGTDLLESENNEITILS